MIKKRVEVELAIKNAGLDTLQKMNASFAEILKSIQNIGKAGESISESGVAKSIQQGDLRPLFAPPV
jgi:hypothetical protein